MVLTEQKRKYMENFFDENGIIAWHLTNAVL